MGDIRLLPGAGDDYEEAFRWYWERSEEAAARFEKAVEAALATILKDPSAWPFLDEKNQFFILTRFPYHIVFHQEGNDIVVDALAHAKRRTAYWKDRPS